MYLSASMFENFFYGSKCERKLNRNNYNKQTKPKTWAGTRPFPRCYTVVIDSSKIRLLQRQRTNTFCLCYSKNPEKNPQGNAELKIKYSTSLQIQYLGIFRTKEGLCTGIIGQFLRKHKQRKMFLRGTLSSLT